MAPRRLLALLAPLLLAWQCPPEPWLLAIPLAEHGRTWERFETVGHLAGDFENPFDPAQVGLTGEFRAPGGRVFAIPGFYTRDYERALVGGYEQLTPREGPSWAVRFTPTEPGTWQWRWVVDVRGDVATSPWRDFQVDPPAPGHHGFLERSPLDPRYLRFSDGAPYLAIGENVGWYDGRGSFAYDDWFAKLAAHGATYARLWMPSWAFGLEWTPGPAGDYRDRLGRAWQLDRVLEAAERHGIHVMLCLQNHGAFSLTTNSEWDGNPYNAANGGPLADPAAVFSDATARELFRRRLRYVVARWGYSSHILAWELWNEVDAVGLGPASDAWHAEMARELDALDPYDHLVSTSFARGETPPVFALPEIDLVQIHHYAYPLGIDIPLVLDVRMRAQAAAFPGKPQLVSELGSDYRGPAETLALDPESIGFHQGLWAGLLTGGFGTGMSWWWDNLVDPEDLYFHFRPLATLTAGIAFDAQRFAPQRPAAAAAGRHLAAYALQGDRTLLAWLQNVDHQWLLFPLPGPDPAPVLGATLALSGLADGAWTARWIDAYTAADVASETVTVAGGAAMLAVPSFARDIALRLEKEPE